MNIENSAKKIMASGKPAFGYSLGIGDPIVTERIAGTGIDFILLDTQHGSAGADSVPLCFMAATAGGSVPMARVASNNYTLIGRLLDEGALGIVVPMVHTPDDARAAAEACRYPGAGQRSFGWARAAAYGDDYPNEINDQVFCAVQIESKQAVENAEAILATVGVDGCWMGPADLSLSYGHKPGSDAAAEVLAKAKETVVAACRNTGTHPGYAGASPEQALQLASEGFQFLTAGSDVGFMMQGAIAGIGLLRG